MLCSYKNISYMALCEHENYMQENLQVNMGNINPVLTNQIAGFWATSN